MTLVWVDGQPATGVSAHDRGLAYGDGLFETMRVIAGQPQLLTRHLQRLENGCQRLGIACDLAVLRTQILAFSAALADGVAKLILTRGDGLRGYASPCPSLPRMLFASTCLSP